MNEIAEIEGETRAPRAIGNPFVRPLHGIIDQLKAIEWEIPFLAQVIQVVVLSLVFVLILLLAVTIGIAFQIGAVFQVLLIDASAKAKTGGFVERSAYAICAGVYLLLYMPFLVIQFPFALIGWIWTFSRSVALVVGILLIGILVVVIREPAFGRAMLEALVAPLVSILGAF